MPMENGLPGVGHWALYGVGRNVGVTTILVFACACASKRPTFGHRQGTNADAGPSASEASSEGEQPATTTTVADSAPSSLTSSDAASSDLRSEEPTGTATPNDDSDSDSSEDSEELAESLDGGRESECGDSELDGAEQCDDGNVEDDDGCSAQCVAEEGYLCDASECEPDCGDGKLVGEQAGADGCDDGNTDDDDGCSATCQVELGWACEGEPSDCQKTCGDGIAQEGESCDEGPNNADGMGCNANCVVSGSVVGTYHRDGMEFCRLGATTSGIEFRANGNALIAVNGFCPEDSLLLGEFDASVTLVRDYATDLLLPEPGLEDSALVGEDWLLATQGCTYRITPEGQLTDVCEPDRITGDLVLEAFDAQRYLAANDAELAMFGPGSPAPGDTPLWVVSAPTTPAGSYSFADATIGHQNSIVRVGSFRPEGEDGSRAIIQRYSSTGNLASTRTDTSIQRYGSVHTSPDGGYLVSSSFGGESQITKLDSNMDVAWSHVIDTSSSPIVVYGVDSRSRVVLGYNASDGSGWTLEKLTSDGQLVMWSSKGLLRNGIRMKIAPDDSIWVTSIYFDITTQLDIIRVAP